MMTSAPTHTVLRHAFAPLIAGTVALALAACTAPGDVDLVPRTGSTPSAPPTEVASSVAECDEVVLSSGESIGGQDLGDCLTATMVAAGTGTHRVESSDGTSSVVDFQWDPGYSMSIDGGDREVIVKGDTGWVRLDGAGWIQADPASTDPMVVVATGIVELTRVFADPRVAAQSFATSPTWTVEGKEKVPADDAVSDVAWVITPDSALTMAGFSVTDVRLWLRSDHLGAYFTGTGSYGGTTVTTTNTFLQWGGAVDIPDPEEE